MQPNVIEYRHPSTPVERRPVMRLVIAVVAGVLLIISVIWCIATWSTPA